MGNRSYLYVVSSSTPDDNFRQIAEANNNFPVLWQILLAAGDAAPAIDYQRVFGDSGTDNLASDAETALARIRVLAAGMREHPLLGTLPGLDLQFEALEMHLAELIEGADSDEGRALFSANLDELAWLDGDSSAEQFIHQCRQECDERWIEVEAALRARNFPALDEALGLNEYRSGFSDWNTWAWSFGLGGLHHEYFQSHEPPRQERFADFVPAVRDDENLEYGCRRLEKDGKFGLQRSDDNGHWRTLLAPEWDEVFFATYDAVWVKRGELLGYALLGEDAAEIVLPPQLDKVEVFFGEGGASCAIVGRDGRQGFLRADGRWLFEPAVDEVWRFENGYAPFSNDGREGYIDSTGKIAIPATYDWVGPFGNAGVAPVNLGEGYGLVRGNGEIALPLTYDGIEWRADLSAFEVTQGDKKGLWHADGRPWLAIEWDEFKCLVPDRLLGMARGRLWGACDWLGAPRVAPEYQQLEVRDSYALSDSEEDAPMPIQLRARLAGKLGLLDETGRVLVPLAYQRCDEFEGLSQDLCGEPFNASLLRVASKIKGSRQKFGAFDIEQQRETVACQYDNIYRAALGGGEFGYLVANDNPKAEHARLGKARVGVLRIDGTPLFGLDYAWLCSAHDLTDGWSRAIVNLKLYRQWQEGLCIQAVRSESGDYVWLGRDGSEQGHAEYLAQRFAAGDLDAALMLGRHYRDGEGIVADPRLARSWLARAAGVPEALAAHPEQLLLPPASTPQPGFFGKIRQRLAGGKHRDDAPPIAPAPGLYRAMYELSLMLNSDEGGPASPGASRYWLEMAARAGGETDDHNVMSQLGYFLCNGIGGDVDRERGIELYQRAAERHSNQACYNLGIIYEWGQGVEADPVKALDYYRQSERLGDGDAAYAVGRLLRADAEKLSGKARRKRLGEAAYSLRRAIDAADCDFVASACGELALIHLDPEAAEHDAGRAEELLLQGAEMDSAYCIELLLDEIYGKAGGPRRDDEKSHFWQARLAEIKAQNEE